jgi:hypothetical protein
VDAHENWSCPTTLILQWAFLLLILKVTIKCCISEFEEVREKFLQNQIWNVNVM